MYNKLKSFNDFITERRANIKNNIPQDTILDIYPNIKKLGNNVTIGQDVVIGNGVVLGDNIILENGVIIEANVTITKGSIVPSGFTVPKGTKYKTEKNNGEFISAQAKLFNKDVLKISKKFKISDKSMDKFKRGLMQGKVDELFKFQMQIAIDAPGEVRDPETNSYDRVSIDHEIDGEIDGDGEFDSIDDLLRNIDNELDVEVSAADIIIQDFHISGLGKIGQFDPRGDDYEQLTDFLLTAYVIGSDIVSK